MLLYIIPLDRKRLVLYNQGMEKNTSKVVVDTELAQEIPTVAVAAPPVRPKPSSSPLPVIGPMVAFIVHIFNFFMDFLETSVVALSIFVVVYLFLIQPHEIKGNSMEPNFHNNEYILTDKISYRFKDPKRGDVIIFKAPRNPDVDYIKRIIGLPKERIKIQKGHVYINGEILNEPYLTDKTLVLPGSSLQEGVEITIPEGYYFVMGDNRPHSSDSREFGPIPNNLIIGHAFVRYWPITQMGIVSSTSY